MSERSMLPCVHCGEHHVLDEFVRRDANGQWVDTWVIRVSDLAYGYGAGLRRLWGILT